MNKTYYMIDFIDDKKKMDFVRENLIYAYLRDNFYGFDLYDVICWNKIHCEKGIYLAREGHYDTVYVRLPKHRHYWRIGEIGKSTYEDYCNNLEAELKKHGVTLEELQFLQRFSSVEYYTDVEKWLIDDKKKKWTFVVEDSYSTDTMIDFLLYLDNGEARSNLAEAHEKMQKNKLCSGNTFEILNYKIRTFYNGKAEVTMADKTELPSDFIQRLEKFILDSAKVHKDSIWCTWVNG